MIAGRTAALARFAPTRAAAIALCDGAGGATLSATVSGVVAGTLIATPAGPVAAEAIRAGDVVEAEDGSARRVAAVSRRALTAEALARDADPLPVRVAAGALAAGVPGRELLLAPGQILLIEGIAAPAAALVDGVSITREPPGQGVTYVRIRLDGPAAFLAEGVACDGFGVRPAAASALAETRRKVEARSGLVHGGLQGNVATAGHGGAEGWALEQGRPFARVMVEFVARGAVVGHALADQRRPDLVMAGVGDGRCGFAVRLPRPLPAGHDYLLQVRRVGDGADVPGSPLLLPRAAGEPADLEQALGRERGAASTETGREDFARFLAERIARLLQARADRPPAPSSPSAE